MRKRKERKMRRENERRRRRGRRRRVESFIAVLFRFIVVSLGLSGLE